jgi:hypothetical protein
LCTCLYSCYVTVGAYCLMVYYCVQEDLWLSAFPIGTEVCVHSYPYIA